MTKVWTYWECQSCGSILRGDIRTCSNCGTPIANTTKYLIPDNPKVIQALSSGKIITSYDTTTDEKGITAEVVPQSLERSNPNWLCTFCGYQNYDESDTCEGCGNPRTPNTPTYFDDVDNLTLDEHTDLDTPKSVKNEVSKLSEVLSVASNSVKQIHDHLTGVTKRNPKKFWITAGSIILAIFLIWLFFPIKRTATICGFHWERSIDVVEYTECHESDWYLPPDAELEYSALEIHHYRDVFDHFETRSRQVSEQVFDGYDTHYRDLGNGQADTVRTPRYRTQYRTEYYEVPVYRQEPVYQTKYYYEIGRWLYFYNLPTSGDNRTPYWQETDIPEIVDSPNYGDIELGSRHEDYYAVVIDYTDSQQNVPYSYDEWMEVNIGDEISYYTFRFSSKPLFNV